MGAILGYHVFSRVSFDGTTASQDDFLMSSNHRSHLLAFKYQVRDPLGVQLTAMASRRDVPLPAPELDSTRYQWRAWLDIDLKF